MEFYIDLACVRASGGSNRMRYLSPHVSRYKTKSSHPGKFVKAPFRDPIPLGDPSSLGSQPKPPNAPLHLVCNLELSR